MVKLEDVARAAGVSASTVSRVLNEPALVNDQTRQRVQRVVREMGYQPSRVARRLRVERGRANLIGLILPDIQNLFFADIARGVEDVAQQQGYTVLLGNSDENVEKERRYLEIMRAESVDGLILPPSCEEDAAAQELARSGIPLVCVDRRLADVAVDTVLVDNQRGAYQAVEHLLRVGHRRIAYVGGLPRLTTTKERLAGYRRALEDHGVEVEAELVRFGDSRLASGRELFGELIAARRPPTALLVGNNLMTLGVLEAIHLHGLRIPDDMALIGYDDMPWAMALNPPLTAVRQPVYEVGRRATELLLQRIRDPERSTTLLVLQPELVVRGSCGVRRRG